MHPRWLHDKTWDRSRSARHAHRPLRRHPNYLRNIHHHQYHHFTHQNIYPNPYTNPQSQHYINTANPNPNPKHTGISPSRDAGQAQQPERHSPGIVRYDNMTRCMQEAKYLGRKLDTNSCRQEFGYMYLRIVAVISHWHDWPVRRKRAWDAWAVIPRRVAGCL